VAEKNNRLKGEVLMQKKWFLVLMGVVLAMGLLVGCSGEAGDPLTETPGEVPADPSMTVPAQEPTEVPAEGTDTEAVTPSE
jgi:hypothetical protein